MLQKSHSNMSRDTVDSVLKSISSLELDNTISQSYTDVAESIRQTGAPSNNTLLSIILSEIRRGNDGKSVDMLVRARKKGGYEGNRRLMVKERRGR